MTVPHPSAPRAAIPVAEVDDASEDLGALALSSQSRSDDRAAAMLERMAAADPQMRVHHLAAAARFRQRAEACRDQVDGLPANGTGDAGPVVSQVIGGG